MIKGFVLVLFAVAIMLVAGCESVLSGTEEITVSNLKCGEITSGAWILDMTTEEVIEESCSDACLKTSMRYSGSYKCAAVTNLLVCDCVITPERKEQLKTVENIQKQEENAEAVWKLENPGKLTDIEVENVCISLCRGGTNLRQYMSDIDTNVIDCGCRDGTDYLIDSVTKKSISEEEYKRRRDAFRSEHPPPPVVADQPPEVSYPTTLEGMWDLIKVGDSAEDYHRYVQIEGFEWIDPPWASSGLSRFRIRKIGSDSEYIQLYFNKQAYTSYGHWPTSVTNNGVEWGVVTDSVIVSKRLRQNGTVTRIDPQ
jgi:hypothetical protein